MLFLKNIIIDNPTELANFFGIISIKFYGLFALIGLSVAIFFTSIDFRRKSLIGLEDHLVSFVGAAMCGLIGSRALYVLANINHFKSNIFEILQVWDGGLSLMGGIILVVVFLVYESHHLNLNRIAYLDLLATYAPLFQSIARIGCLFAGCCYGVKIAANSYVLGVLYTNQASLAPAGVLMYPVQIYSALASFGIFVILFLFSRFKKIPTGVISFGFLFLEGLARGLVDNFRGEGRAAIFGESIFKLFTNSQFLAFLVAAIGFVGLSCIGIRAIFYRNAVK